jgi:glutamyl/glutaminyl-tRNA synthetase
VEAFGDLGRPALVNFLALLGWALDGKTELFSLAELERLFTLERVNPNPAIFDTQKLEWMNGQHLKRLDEADRVGRVMAYLSTRGHRLADRGPEWCTAFVRTLGDRVRTLADAEDVGAFVLRDELHMESEAWDELLARPAAADRLESLAERLQRVPDWTLASIEAETRALATEAGVKAGEVIAPARVALTGRKAAPGIFEVIWLLGRERAVSRLRALRFAGGGDPLAAGTGRRQARGATCGSDERLDCPPRLPGSVTVHAVLAW